MVVPKLARRVNRPLTTPSPLQAGGYVRQPDGSYLVEGATLLRELNRKLGFGFPLDGPKTLNGLILEQLQDIPEADVSIKVGNVPMEIVHAQGRTIKTVRIFKPVEIVESTEPSEA